MQQGYIRLHRSLLDWEWYKNIPVRILFEHCLLKANFQDRKWQGIEIKRGSFLTSLEKLAIETGLTVQQVRTAIKKLKTTGELTCETTSQHSIITINCYDVYQAEQQTNNKQITSNQQTNNKQITTNNNEKNDKNDKNEEEEEKKAATSTSLVEQNFEFSEENPERLDDLKNFYGEYKNVHLTNVQYDKLKCLCLNDKLLNGLINELSENIAGKKNRASPYDEKFPEMHYIALKKYYQYKINNVIGESNSRDDYTFV